MTDMWPRDRRKSQPHPTPQFDPQMDAVIRELKKVVRRLEIVSDRVVPLDHPIQCEDGQR